MIILRKQSIQKTIIFVIIIAGILSALTLYLYHTGSTKKDVEQTSTNVTNNQYEILVDIEESVLYLIRDKQIVKTYSCSGGKW